MTGHRADEVDDPPKNFVRLHQSDFGSGASGPSGRLPNPLLVPHHPRPLRGLTRAGAEACQPARNLLGRLALLDETRLITD